MRSIPKIIHLIFLDDTEHLPHTFSACLKRIYETYPDWDIRIYNEDDAVTLIKDTFPEVLKVYQSYRLNVQKSDLLRVLLLYFFGGVYMDLDMLPLKKLDELTTFQLVLAEEKTISNREKTKLGLKSRLRIANYMFAGVSGHRFWLYVLRELVKRSHLNISSDEDILENTGPGLLTDVFQSVRKNFQDIVLLRNIDRTCLSGYHHAIACHFGNFAAHLHRGTWRNKVRNIGNLVNSSANKEDYERLLKKLNMQIGKFKISDSELRIFPSKIELLEYPNTYDLYKTLDFKLKTYVPGTQGKYVLHFGCPINDIKNTSKTNINIIVLSTSNFKSNSEWMASVNQNFQACIVLNETLKENLFNLGIEIPIKLIPIGFKRIKRQFESKTKMGNSDSPYTLGVSINHLDLQIFVRFIRMVKELKEKSIPELRVHILGKNKTYHVGKNIILHDLLIENKWITFHPISEDASAWYNGIHCYISCSQMEVFELGPLVSLYMGIPTILWNWRQADRKLFGTEYFLTSTGSHDNDLTEIENRLLAIYQDYSYYNNLFVNGANWIQDRFSNDEAALDIINYLKT